MKDDQVIVSTTAVAYVLGVVTILVVLASIGAHLTAFLTGHGTFPSDDPGSKIDEIVMMFSVDREQNLPTFYSYFLLIFAALLLAVITLFEHRRNNPHAFYWGILSFGFIVMAGDELLRFHEKLINPLRGMLGNDYWGIFHYPWVIPYSVLVLLLALFYLRFLFSLTKTTRRTFLLAATLYISGAIGCELVSAYVAKTMQLKEHMLYVMITSLEESLEMVGVVVFIWALLLHISQLQRSPPMS